MLIEIVLLEVDGEEHEVLGHRSTRSESMVTCGSRAHKAKLVVSNNRVAVW